VADARHRITTWLERRGVDDEELNRVILVASELVSNAVRHARTAFELDLRPEADGTSVEVFDCDTRLPVLLPTDTEATSGRGLQIVAALSTEWGARREARQGIQGKTVWAICRD
jgi:anti-sigma regulatory factor (Ser/Thr protein kinase)